MTSRTKTTLDKKTKRYKRTSWLLIFIIVLCVMGFAILAGLLYAEYEQTETWSGSELDQEMASIPPEFAQNTYDINLLDDIEQLGALTDSLSAIDEHNGLTKETIDEARKAADITETLLTTHNIESGGSYDNLTRLQLYIDVYDIEQTIYDTLDTETLENVMTRLAQRTVFMEDDVDKRVLSRLHNIVDDINALNAFIDTMQEPLGELAETTLRVSPTMNRETTSSMLTYIEEQNLTVFRVIKDLNKVLSSHKWEAILVNNETLRDISLWTEQWAYLNTLSQGQYRRIEALPTLASVQDTDWISVQGLDTQRRQEILGSSVVQSLSVNGEEVSSGQYVKRDLRVQAIIDPVYQVVSIPEEATIPTFDQDSDYSTLREDLTALLDERDKQLEQERLEEERLEEERLEQERLEEERLEEEQSETDASTEPNSEQDDDQDTVSNP